MAWALGLLLAVISVQFRDAASGMESCYDDAGRARRCLPEFCNAAFNKTIRATNTCGSAPEQYCLQTGVTGVTESCHLCDVRDPSLSHNASSLNDFHSEQEPTWWQSQSMVFPVQYPNTVNLTLHLGKSFEITYVRLKFHTSRPESFAIYKRTREDGPWVAYQYYSASCARTHQLLASRYLRPGEDERVALCTEEFSDISPLTGGNVAFSTLEGRPSAYSFDGSAVLQEWVTATDLLISLNRLNTFGDDIFQDPKVLKSYYYSISDFSVGGRCKCNGHASQCVTNGEGRLVCDCQHDTAGVDCQKCRPFFHDRPWSRGSGQSANVCLPCNCSGRSEECVFNRELYRSTGHGGQCLNCRDNTTGPHCETCQQQFYRNDPVEPCEACNCNLKGSLSLQCDAHGDCLCKPNVTGKKCNLCQLGSHSLTEGGCRPCACRPEGSVGQCDPNTGRCTCKKNVEGSLCHSCKPGTFNLQPRNVQGCVGCFCYGHSTACTSASQFAAAHVTSTFLQGDDKWRGQDADGGEFSLHWEQERISLLPGHTDGGHFIAPRKFLGNQLLSYGQNLSFAFEADSRASPSFRLVLEGSGIRVSASVAPQTASDANPQKHVFAFRLDEAEGGIQTPALSSFQFHRLLSNLTAMKIGGSGSSGHKLYLKEVALTTARPGLSPPASWVEECLCPQGYIGQFCQTCAPGYKREVAYGDAFARCVACSCNQHGSCKPDSGVCQCTHHTAGPACQRCADGYYGNPLRGRYNDCRPCPCPGQSSCATVEETKEVVCTHCPEGQTGKLCDRCDDGYFGDPLGRRGEARPCSPCRCGGNIDANAVGNCHHLSGQCLKCLFHTVGRHCHRCADGFYGNALATDPPDRCRPCDCNPAGSTDGLQTCDPQSGRCSCLPHVTDRACGHCEPGYFNLRPGAGCDRCDCHPEGSRNSYCHLVTGHCPCRPGIEGTSCDKCQRGYFDFSAKGCRACNCSPLGSVRMQCRENGTCECRTGFGGYKCDQCHTNYFYNPSTFHCQQCPVCYGLVRDQTDRLKEKLHNLEEGLDKSTCRSDHWHQYYSIHLESAVRDMVLEARSLQGAKDIFLSDMRGVESSLEAIGEKLSNASRSLSCEENQIQCRLVSGSHLLVLATHAQLRAVRETLNQTVTWRIPIGTESDSNNRISGVQEARTLAASHGEVAEKVYLLVGEALSVSNESYALLTDILRNRSSEDYLTEVEDKIEELQSAKEELEREVERALGEAKKLYTSTQRTPPLNITQPQPEVGWKGLEAEIANLEKLLQSKERLVDEAMEEVQTQAEELGKQMAAGQNYTQLLTRANTARASGMASVQAGRQIRKETNLLLKQLDDNKKRFSSRRAKTRGAVKKVRSVREKVLPVARKKTAQAARVLRAAQANAATGNATAVQALHLSSQVSREAQTIRTKAEGYVSVSSVLRSDLARTQAKVEVWEKQVGALKATASEDLETAAEVNAGVDTMGENMKKAKQSLDYDVKKLTELLKAIEGLKLNPATDEVLNETQTRVSSLRSQIDGQLTRKVRTMEAAAETQVTKMKMFERDITEIVAEKHSLEDIARNLPRGCYNRPGARRQ